MEAERITDLLRALPPAPATWVVGARELLGATADEPPLDEHDAWHPHDPDPEHEPAAFDDLGGGGEPADHDAPDGHDEPW